MNNDKNIITRSREYIRENLPSIVLILLCVAWLLTGLVVFRLTGKEKEAFIADTIMLLLLGLSINRLCTIMGIKKGKQTDKYISTTNLHGAKVTEAAKDINALVKWCDKENIENKKEEQTKLLIPLGICYEDFIEDKIDYKKFEKSNKFLSYISVNRMKKKIKKIKHIKLKQVSVDALTTTITENTDKFDFGRSEKKYIKSEDRGDIVSKILFYVFLGSLSMDLLINFSYASLILRIVQLVMLLALGAFKYANAYTFIVDEFRAGTIKKINHLDRFLNEQKGGEN